MFRIALKGILARKGRLLLTSLAVIAGCAFLSGVFVFTDTLRHTVDELFSNAYEKTDAWVRSSNEIDQDFGEDARDTIDVSMLDEVAAVPGVASVAPWIDGSAVLARDGDTLGSDNGPPTLGAAYTDSPSSPFTIVQGHAPSGPDEIAITDGAADRENVAVGDHLSVTSIGGSRDVTVVGIATFAETTAGPTWVLFDVDTAQDFVLGTAGRINAVAVTGDGSMSDAALRDTIRTELQGHEVQVLTGEQIAEESQDSIQEALGFVTTFLTVFAALSLLVGSFIIYNVFSISAAQRQRENALLRAIGASRAQVTRSQFVEALAVAVLGGLLGFGGGIGLAFLITWLLSRSGNSIGDASLLIQPSAFVITMIVAIFVTLVCAIAPAIRAGRVPPLAAMRDLSIDHSGVSRGRVVTGVVMLVIAAATIALGLTSTALWLAPGIVSLFVGLIVLGPVFAAPISRILTKPLSAVTGVTGEIAGRNAATSPKRTALTAAALGIGLALLVAVSTLGSSLTQSLRSTIGDAFTGDFAVASKSDGNGQGLLPPAITTDLNELPEVGDAVGLAFSSVKVVKGDDTDDTAVLVVEAQHAKNLYTLDFVGGSWDALTKDTVLLSESTADDEGVETGSPYTVRLLDGSEHALTVGGVFSDDNLSDVIMDRSLFAGTTAPLFDWRVFVQSAPGYSGAEVRAAITSVTEKYPTSKLQSRTEFIDAQVDQISGVLTFIYALLLMSVFIALLGIVITLLLAVYERRRELGLVRAIGMTRGQVRASIRWEGLITALLGVLLGVGLGVALGWIVVTVFKDEGLNTFALSIPSIVLFVALAVVFALVAAWYPARKAAKADILQAIATT